MITGQRITRPQAATEILASNRLQIRELFPGAAPRHDPGPSGHFPRSATFRWLLERRVDLVLLIGTWLLRRGKRAVRTPPASPPGP